MSRVSRVAPFARRRRLTSFAMLGDQTLLSVSGSRQFRRVPVKNIAANSIKSKPSSALDQANDHDDDGNHEQEMDEPTANVADEAEKPEHDQDDNYSPEHGVPFD